MAPSMPLSVAAWCLVGATSDETSLMQGLHMKGVHRRDSKSVSTLLETAGNLLKNGATPDVVEFAQATLVEISDMVIPAIENASSSDQKMLEEVFGQFLRVRLALEEGNMEISEREQEESHNSVSHKACRVEEAHKCEDKVTCDYDIYERWGTFIDCERDLRDIQTDIDRHFCFDLNGTLTSFRQTSTGLMHSFITKWAECQVNEEHYDDQHPICTRHFNDLDDKTAACDDWQSKLEESACAHALSVREVRTDFARDWKDAVDEHEREKAQKRILQADRINEYRALCTVQCLLARTSERNGRPCDEHTDEAETEVTFCETQGCDDSFLYLTYNETPPLPPACPDRRSVEGYCYPDIQPWPCQTQFITQEYSMLPGVPIEEFSATNSHCNARPDCQPCTEMDSEHGPTIMPHPSVQPPTVVVTLPPPPDTDCGSRPELTNAVWSPSITLHGATVGSLLQYHCEDGYSFNGWITENTRDIQCLPSGFYTQLRQCLPIDDCNGHSCGAFGFCIDMHMDYTCDCLSGYDMADVDGEKMCGTPDDCHGAQCGAGGTCETLLEEDGYRCLCQDGFEEGEESPGNKVCQRKDCGEAPVVQNVLSMSHADRAAGTGLFPYTSGKALYGAILEYECAEGYSTNGQIDGPRSFAITCQADGEFTPVQLCLPLSCGEPQASGSAQPASSDPVSLGETVQYHCPVGHAPQSFPRTCEVSGELSGAIACEPRLCRPLPRFATAVPPSPTHPYAFGDVAEFTCVDGHSTDPSNPASGQFSLECGANDWSMGEGCFPVQCDYTPHETHVGEQNYIMEYGGFNIVKCVNGHSSDGTPRGATDIFAHCSAQGVVAVPPCMPVHCTAEHLPITLHSHIVETRDYRVGTQATYQCDEGFETALTAAPSFEIECLRAGGFSTPSTCRNIDDCDGHSCGGKGTCLDGINAYSCVCEDGFEETVSDSGERACGNVDDCGPNACGPNGVCNDLINAFECHCHDGYELGAENQMCVAKTCLIEMLEGVNMESQITLQYPQTLFLECVHGHGFNSQVGFEVECNQHGETTSSGDSTLPQCTPVSCGLAKHVAEAVVSPAGEFFYGDSAEYECQDGVIVVQECQADGQFEATSQFNICQNSCGSPPIPSHGARLDGTGLVFHPSSVTYACNAGFTHLESGAAALASEVSQKCRADGTLEQISSDILLDSNGLMICNPIVCERPTAPANWMWAGEHVWTSLAPATLMCAEGFQSNGWAGWNSQIEVLCGVDGQSSLDSVSISPCDPIIYFLSGQVRSATTTIAIPGASIDFGNGITIQTDSQGSFSVQLPAGEFSVSFSAESYIRATDTVSVSADRRDFNLILSPVLDSHNWRIVLEWGQSPRDLDSHLIMQTPVGYDDCETWWGASSPGPCNRMYGVTATLDVDDRYSHGPETITLSNVENCGTEPYIYNRWYGSRQSADCRFIYKVKNYPTGSDGWDVSQAKVTVYNGDRQVGDQFTIDASSGYGGSDGHGYTSRNGVGTGDDWGVVQYDTNDAGYIVAYSNEFWSVFAIDPLAGTVTPCTDFMCSP